MANPDPNLRRERERHAGPLIGMALVVIFAVALIFWWLMDEAADAPGPNTTIEQNDIDVTAPPASEGEGATDLPDPVDPDVVTPEPAPQPAPDLTPAPDAAGESTGGATGTGGTTTQP